MFHVEKGAELTPELLRKMMERFKTDVLPGIVKAKDYYNGKQAILSKTYADPSKPCSKTVTNFCKNIADTYRGYLASAGYISYTSKEDISEVVEVLQRNDYQSQDSEYMLNALKCGRAAELCFIDAIGQVRFRQIDPATCFGIYDDTLSNDLLYFVRWYPVNEWDGVGNWAVDVYSDTTKTHYTMDGEFGGLQFVSEEPHYFAMCPANIFYLEDEKPIFECVYELQDSYNELMSSELDDYSAFCDAYLALTGVDADAEEVASMKTNRVLLLPEGSAAQWLTKNANDAQVENILNRTHSDIYRIAQCPDLSAESFVGGVSSGIAIKYRLTGIETRAAGIAAAMAKALRRRVDIIMAFAALKSGDVSGAIVNIDFKRNIPEDMSDTIKTVASLQGIVSDRTIIGLLPFVDDVDAELEAIAEQKQANVAMFAFNGMGAQVD